MTTVEVSDLTATKLCYSYQMRDGAVIGHVRQAVDSAGRLQQPGACQGREVSASLALLHTRHRSIVMINTKLCV